MDSKFLKICLLAGIVASMAACDEGKNNDLSCDDTFQPECLSARNYMACEGGVLTVKDCGETSYCKDLVDINGNSAAVCVNYNGNITPTNNCGNGFIDNGEDCDGTNLNGKSCTDVISGSTGTLACSSSCKFDTSACSGGTTASSCGNGVIEGDEDCEGANLNGKNCADVLEGSTGVLACNPNTCFFNALGCKIENTFDDYCKSNADCASVPGSECVQGVCLTQEMKGVDKGDECNPNTFVEFCLDNAMVYCGALKDPDTGDYMENDEGGYVYGVYISDCSEYNGCTIVDGSGIYGMDETYYTAWCKNNTYFFSNEEAEAYCQNPGKVSYCTNYEGLGDLESYIECLPNTDGTLTAIDGIGMSEYAECYDATGEDYGDCDAKGEHCGNFMAYYCDAEYACLDDNTLYSCDDSWAIFGIISADEISCSQAIPGSKCASVNGEDYCYTSCNKLGESITTCEYYADYDLYVSMTMECSKGLDGNLYSATVNGEVCYNGCVDGVGCTHLVSDEGQDCGSTYADRCENNAAVTCYDGVVAATLCEDDEVCHVGSKGTSSCMKSCTGLNQTMSSCSVESIFGYEYAFVDNYVCKQFDDGLFYEYTDYQGCEFGCSDDKASCKKLIEDQFEPCDAPGTYIDCRGDILVMCDKDGEKYPVDCKSYGYDTCKYGPTFGTYFCVDACMTATEVAPVCLYFADSDESASYNEICEQMDGGLYEMRQLVEECEDDCNAEGTACE